MINILLVEDHKLVRDGVQSLLKNDSGLNVADVAEDGKQALEKLDAGLDVSVILSDITMPHMDGFELTKSVNDKFPNIKVIFLTMLDDEDTIQRAFISGAKGYLLKVIGVDELIFSIKHVSQGHSYICSHLSIGLLDKNRGLFEINDTIRPVVSLTSRETEILKLVATGMTNGEIAEKLFTSKRTVEGHRQNLLTKTGTKNAAALIRFAIQNQLLADQ